ENFRALLVGHEDAALQRKAPNELPIVCVNFRDDVGPVGFERVNFRQVAGIDEEQAGAGPEQDRAEQKKRQSDAVNQFPAAKTQGDRGKAQHRKKSLAQLKRNVRQIRKTVSKFHRYELDGAVQGCGSRASTKEKMVISNAKVRNAPSLR